jgi:hypothetical protein
MVFIRAGVDTSMLERMILPPQLGRYFPMTISGTGGPWTISCYRSVYSKQGDSPTESHSAIVRLQPFPIMTLYARLKPFPFPFYLRGGVNGLQNVFIRLQGFKKIRILSEDSQPLQSGRDTKLTMVPRSNLRCACCTIKKAVRPVWPSGIYSSRVSTQILLQRIHSTSIHTPVSGSKLLMGILTSRPQP